MLDRIKKAVAEVEEFFTAHSEEYQLPAYDNGYRGHAFGVDTGAPWSDRTEVSIYVYDFENQCKLVHFLTAQGATLTEYGWYGADPQANLELKLEHCVISHVVNPRSWSARTSS